VSRTGTVARGFGALQPGDTMRAHFAVFLEIRGGRIVSQRNYDCFDPF
jgi:ketosteroid isomerase-like protein